jgi:hypothetical protein
MRGSRANMLEGYEAYIDGHLQQIFDSDMIAPREILVPCPCDVCDENVVITIRYVRLSIQRSACCPGFLKNKCDFPRMR